MRIRTITLIRDHHDKPIPKDVELEVLAERKDFSGSKFLLVEYMGERRYVYPDECEVIDESGQKD